MKKTQERFVRTTIASSLLLAFAVPCSAADEMTQLTRPNSEVTAGAAFQSDPTTLSGLYTGLRDERVNAQVDFSVTERNDASGLWTTFSGRNLGREDAEFRLEQSTQGSWRYYFDFNRTPHYDPLAISTKNTGIGTDSITAPGTGPLLPIELKTVRERFAFGVDRQITDSIDASLRLQTEDKSGTRYFGQTSHAFTPEPIGSTTDQWEAKFGYTDERFQLSAGYYGSRYQNDFDRLAVTSGTQPVALAPSNQSHQLFASGGFNLSPRMRGTVKVSFTSATQNDIFYTAPTNPAIASLNNLDAKVNTLLVNAGFTARPTDRLNVLASVRYEDRDDRTGASQFITSVSSTRSGFNFAPSRKSLGAKLEAGYRLPDNYKVVAGIDYEEIERNAPSARQASWRTENRETGARVELRKSLAETLNGAIKLQRSERRGSNPYLEAGSAADADVIAPVHFTDRIREKIKLSMDWTPVDRLSVQFAAEQSVDDYRQRDVGPANGTAALYSIDASYALSDDWQLSAWYTHDETVADGGSCAVSGTGAFCGITTGATAWQKWYSRLSMKGDAAGLGVKGKIGSKLSLGADGELALTRSLYRVKMGENRVNGAGTLPTAGTDLPSHAFRLGVLKVYADYAYRPELSVRAQFQHQRMSNNDWLWTDGNGSPYYYGASLAAANTTVSQPTKEIVNIVGVSLTYKWW